jgi:hypothetical protein
MKAGNKPPLSEARERYLGEIAPLLEAARNVDSLPPERKRQVRRRILRSAFGQRRWGARSRLTPLLAALGLLVVGSAAFAMAEHWGLLPRLDFPNMGPPVLPAAEHPRKHRAVRSASTRSSRGLSDSIAPAVSPAQQPVVGRPAPAAGMVPSVPDPLLAEPPPAVFLSRPARGDVALAEEPLRPGSTLSAEPPARLRAPTRMAPRRMALVREAPITPEPRAWTVPPASPSFWAQLDPVSSPPAATAEPAAAITPPPPPAVAPASPARPAAAPAHPAIQLARKEVPSDQALFAQAMHRLRSEGNPAAALAMLQEHGRSYPGSALAGERTSLEVESLLALHRSREALALLDTLSLDELPRSGERFVVRGELRAAARRWIEAGADFDRALSRVSGSPSWYERALWGRAVSRLRMGEREAGMADMERYLDRFPHGRFASEAAKFFPHR